MRTPWLSGTIGAAIAALIAVAPPSPSPSAAEARVAGFASLTARLAQAPACVPVPGAECGSVQVPLFWSDPAGPKIDVAYALLRHSDPALPAARGTVVLNPGGPGDAVIGRAGTFAKQLSGLLADHDLLLIDPRGIGRSHPIRCGATTFPPPGRASFA